MLKSDLFCFFSGFAHRDIELVELSEDPLLKIITLHCVNQGKHAVLTGDYIQLDGVLFKVTSHKEGSFKACTTFELAEGTSIKEACPGNQLTLGILAEQDVDHSDLWMLHPSAAGRVTYQKCSVLAGHEHTLKLDFTTSPDLASAITEGCHLGLAGSSLTAREVGSTESHLFFSIYCGRETRENSQFNASLTPGTQVNVTEAAGIYHSTVGL